MICSNCKTDCSDDSLYCGKCGQSLIGSDMQITRNDFSHELKNNRSFNFMSGENFGDRYRIISELGKGGMGQVFKAHDNVLDIDVALKMIRPEFLMNKKMIARFKQEILLAREITHENVSRIHDFGDVDGIKFISMEFISGRTLKDIVRKDGPIDIEQAIEISKAICSGLSAAHKKEIIHRDLKPQNIMIDDEGHVFITDFGLAKSVREENVSHTGLVIGTPQYIPPELWKGEVADKRSDIYSLGIIMYEMVVGEELFQSDSDYGYLQKHVNEDPEFPYDIKDKLPGFFRQLILRCLAKERDARYQDCGEVYRDMKDRLYSTGTFLNNFERSIKKTGYKKIGLAFLLILLISFFGSLILKKGPPVQKKRSVAILYFKNLSGMKDLDYFSYSLPELLTTDLGQSKYIKVLPEDKVSKILKESNYLSASFIDEKLFEDLGDQAGVNYLVQGSFIKSGDNLRITVKLRDSDSGELLSTDFQDATMDNIFPAVDRLTTGLKKRFNLTENEIFADIDSEIASITTSSHEALNHYITGKRLFNERKLEESLVEYQKAVDIDTEFAMAYQSMALSYAHLYNWEKRREYYEKTLKYVNKMSIREKFLIYGGFYGEQEESYEKAIEAYQKILDIYPNDYQANYHLGQLFRISEEWDKAIGCFIMALKEDRSSIYALNEIIICYLNTGEFDKAEELIRTYRNENKSDILNMILRNSYFLKIAQNKLGSASSIVDSRNLFAEKSGSKTKFNKGLIYFLEGKYKETENIILELENNPALRSYPPRSILKYFSLFRGKFKDFERKIKQEISESSSISTQNDYKFQLVYIYLTSGLYEKVNSELKDLIVEKGFPFTDLIITSFQAYSELNKKNLIKAGNLIKKIEKLVKITFFKKLSRRILFQLKAEFHEKKGEFDRADEFFKRSLENQGKLFDEFSANYFYKAAMYYFRTKQFKEAEKQFYNIHKLTLGRFYRGDLYAKSYYYLGKIYLKLGQSKKSIKFLKEFLEMWKDGDPEITAKLIQDTRHQLSQLEK